MEASEVSGLLYKNLNYRAERQKVIAGNIANLDTPGFKTKDVSFDQAMQKAQNKNDLQMVVTHKNHIPFELNNKQTTSKAEIYQVDGLVEQNDGNNVNLDQQISEMSKNAVMYDAITNAIKKDSRWFKTMIESSGKN